MQVGPRVAIRLSHIVREGSRTIYYRLQIAWVDRPPVGSRTGRLKCVTCGEMVAFRVHSEANTKKRKRKMLAVLLLSLTVFGGAIAAIAVGGDDLRESTLAWLGGGLACGSISAGMAALLFFSEDGVTWTHYRQQVGPHRLKPVSLLGAAITKPPVADSPSKAEIAFDD